MLKHDRTVEGDNGRVTMYIKPNGSYLVTTRNNNIKKKFTTEDRQSALSLYRHYEGMIKCI